jgi:hypothetical protein
MIIPVKEIAVMLLAAVLHGVLQAQPAAEVRGSVVDARGGEALSNVVVQLVGGAYRDTRTFQANVTLDTMFPILPSAGIVFER